MASGLAEKSVSADFEAAFSAYYLCDETYLGRRATNDATVPAAL